MRWHAKEEDALSALAADPTEQVAYLIRHGSMRAGLYTPLGVDDQTPHTQDELYIVARGRARFTKAGEAAAVEPGTILFVEAGAPHGFSDMEEGFAVWVVFWGPPGGEP